MSQQIKLRISPDGQIQAEVLGFRGKKCADYIAILEQLLDAETIDSEPTAEYWQEVVTVNTEITPLQQTNKQER
jgi:hypothetical protein